ncbi:MAG: excinuclease ABC subunit UvrA, partial [Phycisphaerae bacterium]
MAAEKHIAVVGARQHNLKNITVQIPHGAFTVVTGLSGSGKSTLAFDTVYAEGERKYVESLSAYARQFLEQMPKPDVDRIDGLCPTIAIQQRAAASNPRSTVATTTEIHDYLRLLFAQVGEPHCCKCLKPIVRHTTAEMVDAVLAQPQGARAIVLAPLNHGEYKNPEQMLEAAAKNGFVRVRIDGKAYTLEEAPSLSKRKKARVDVVVDRLMVRDSIAVRLADSLELALKLGGGRVVVAVGPDSDHLKDLVFSHNFACPDHLGVTLWELSPRVFSFNSPYGACRACDGLGTVLEFDPELVVPDSDRTLENGAIVVWPQGGKRAAPRQGPMMGTFCKQFGVSPEIPFRNIAPALVQILMHGTTARDVKTHGHKFEGVIPHLQRRWESTDSETVKQRLHRFLSESPCRACAGARLRPESLAVTVGGKRIAEISAMSVGQARVFFDALRFQGEAAVIAKQPLREIRNRLKFLQDVGVGYLSLSRGSATLSGGEVQRIRLATQIGSGLMGVCYVLDEPTIGLHQRDSRRLVNTLKRLAD